MTSFICIRINEPRGIGYKSFTRYQRGEAMVKCGKCGALGSEGQKFCSSCGAPLAQKAVGETPVMTAYAEPEDRSFIQGFTPPSEKFEVGTNANGSVKELEKLLISANGGDYVSYLNKGSWSNWNIFAKMGWGLLWVFFFPLMTIYYLSTSYRFNRNRLKANELRCANIVENYVFANDQNTTLEALYFIKGQIDQLENISKNSYMAFWVSLWRNKAMQLYQRSVAYHVVNPAVKDIYDEIDNQTQYLLDSAKKKYWVKLVVLAVAALLLTTGTVAYKKYTDYKAQQYYKTFIYNEDEEDLSMDAVNETNTVVPSEFSMRNIVGNCFDISDKNIEMKVLKEENLVQLDFELVCKKDFRPELQALIEEKGVTGTVDDYYYGNFVFNGNMRANISNYGGMDSAAGSSALEKMLAAKEGDVIPIRLYCEYSTYSKYSIDEVASFMRTDTLMMNMELTFFEGEEFIDIK
jgi:hypothetical protein